MPDVPPLAQSLSRAIAIFDIDGVVRDVGGSYRRALADTVEQFTAGAYRPSPADIDRLKSEGLWNNDWEASQELVYRHFEAQGQARAQVALSYEELVAFFQRRYRGTDPIDWNGYIAQEPLLLQSAYLDHLTEAQVGWGFFSGATRGSATYVLEKRLGLRSPLLVAMEDAPGKPNPMGLLAVVQQLEALDPTLSGAPVVYVGDTVADMQTVQRAIAQVPDRRWIGVGILPPHAQQPPDYAAQYHQTLVDAGAVTVLSNVQQLTASVIQQLCHTPLAA